MHRLRQSFTTPSCSASIAPYDLATPSLLLVGRATAARPAAYTLLGERGISDFLAVL
jgi:hypothetical protein